MKSLLLILVLLSFVLPSTAASKIEGATDGMPAGYSKRHYGLVDGLPESTVQAFAQTSDHNLWIGTTGGLVRFDGVHFTIFDRENTSAFRENSVFCLLSAADGSLWIGTEGSGLIRYRDGVFTAFGQQEGLTDTFVRAIAQDHLGRILIGTNNGLFQMHGQRVERMDAIDTIPAVAVNSIYEDRRGRVWLGGSRLLCLESGHGVREYRLPGDAARNRVKVIAETSGGVIWAGTVAGLYRLAPVADQFVRMSEVRGTVRVLRQAADGTLWVGVVGSRGAAYRIDDHMRLVSPIALNTGALLSVFEDAEHDVWLGTETGMLRLSKTPLSIVPLPDATASDFGTVYQDRDGTLWAASTYLFRLRNGTPATLQKSGARQCEGSQCVAGARWRILVWDGGKWTVSCSWRFGGALYLAGWPSKQLRPSHCRGSGWDFVDRNRRGNKPLERSFLQELSDERWPRVSDHARNASGSQRRSVDRNGAGGEPPARGRVSERPCGPNTPSRQSVGSS